MSARRAKSSIGQVLSWLAVAFVLALPLAPTLHALGTAHHLCREHGTVEHGAATADRHHAHQAPAIGAAHPSADHEQSHEQCAALSLLKHVRGAPEARVMVAPQRASWTALALGPAASHADLARLDLAPKTSPPPTA